MEINNTGICLAKGSLQESGVLGSTSEIETGTGIKLGSENSELETICLAKGSLQEYGVLGSTS